MSVVTKFCSNYSIFIWAILGLIILLLLVYIFVPCVFDIFSWSSLCKLFSDAADSFNQAIDIGGSKCLGTSSCGCGGCSGSSGDGYEDDSLSGSGSGGSGVGPVGGQGNVVVNLPAINVVVNSGSNDGSSGSGSGTGTVTIPPIIIPPISTNPLSCNNSGSSATHVSGGCGCNPGNAANMDCEITDSVFLCGKRYAITYLPGIIRVYDSNGSTILSIITHNLGVLRSIRYQNDMFVVEDEHSNEFQGSIVSGAINFTPVP